MEKCGIALNTIWNKHCRLHLTETEIDRLQKIENSVYRKTLGGTKNTAIAALRGDIGASAMRTRVAAGKMQYINSVCIGKKRHSEGNTRGYAGKKKQVVENVRKIYRRLWNDN